jgi:dTDP-4-amino-4,6-dideoxygalactose transaminase
MAAILCDIQPGDEVIIPSYTFVSTANAFVLRGAKIVFADSSKNYPGIDESKIESLITSHTKVIVPVHYAGVACDMDIIMGLANRYSLLVVEDAAQAIDSYYNGRPLGGIGHFGCFSFHETKNIQCGEGGMLVINDERFLKRSEIIWEKGTNRAEFYRGETNKYGWVDIGSSFLPSEVSAAFLWAQIENLEEIQNRRRELWYRYYEGLKQYAEKEHFTLPKLPGYATNNAHMFYLVCKSMNERNFLIPYLRENGVLAIFHYLSLHRSEYYLKASKMKNLPNAENYEDCLLRFPLYYELKPEEIEYILSNIIAFFESDNER